MSSLAIGTSVSSSQPLSLAASLQAKAKTNTAKANTDVPVDFDHDGDQDPNGSIGVDDDKSTAMATTPPTAAQTSAAHPSINPASDQASASESLVGTATYNYLGKLRTVGANIGQSLNAAA